MDSSPNAPSVSRTPETLYRLLLRAYPSGFRGEYGREMLDLFMLRLENEPASRVWFDVVTDLAVAAPREHVAILRDDLRLGQRAIRKAPASAFLVLLAMTLGIGATTAVFSLVHAVLLRGFPYPDVDRLVYVWTPNPRFEGTPREFAPMLPDAVDIQRQSHSYSSLAMFDEGRFLLGGAQGAKHVEGARVGGNFFAFFAARPVLGRAIDEGDGRTGDGQTSDNQPGHQHVVVIGDALWQSRFGGARDVIGKPLLLDRVEYTIVGVMGPGFSYPHASDFPTEISGIKRAELWIPAAWTEKQKSNRANLNELESCNVIARLRPGVTLAQAQAEAAAIIARVDPLYPETFRGWQAYVQSFGDAASGSVRTMMWLLLGAVSLVLLIACVNVAGLLAARAAGRLHEMGVRAALGAGRARLVRQMLTESLILAAIGGGLGILCAMAAMRLIVRLNPGDIPRLDEIALNGAVLGFAVAASLAAGLLAGLAPALAASRVNLTDLLRQGGRGAIGSARRMRDILIVGEVALAMILLAGAGLLIRSYLKLQQVDAGFSTQTLTTRLMLDRRYGTMSQQQDFFRRVLEQTRAIPGVETAGIGSNIPLGHHFTISFLQVEGYPNQKGQMVEAHTVTGGFFEALQTRLLAGRSLRDGDKDVVAVSRGFADTYFAGRDPLGRRVRLGDGPESHWQTVVGIVADVHQVNLEDRPRPVLYGAFFTGGGEQADLAIRTQLTAPQMTTALRGILAGIDAGLAPGPVRPMDALVSEANSRRRFQTVVLAVFAAIAVLLPLVGLYGLTAYSVKQRTGEIGIRMTLGATRGRVVRMIVRQGVTLVAIGLALGVAGALAVTRITATFLYGVAPRDPLTFAVAPAFLLLVAAMACVIPASKAARVNPVEALRNE